MNIIVKEILLATLHAQELAPKRLYLGEEGFPRHLLVPSSLHLPPSFVSLSLSLSFPFSPLLRILPFRSLFLPSFFPSFSAKIFWA